MERLIAEIIFSFRDSLEISCGLNGREDNRYIFNFRVNGVIL